MSYYVYETRTFEETYKGVPMTLVLTFEEEPTPLEDTFDDNVHDLKELYRQIDAGTLVYFCAVMKAYINGVEFGWDSLGACLYKSFDEFINEDGYFADMKQCAMEYAYENAIKTCQMLKESPA